MSDEQQLSATVEVERRKVVRLHTGLYHVALYTEDHGWILDGRGYRHSTSAYAKLGRILNREIAQQQ